MTEMLAQLQAFCTSLGGPEAPFKLAPGKEADAHTADSIWVVFPVERLMVAESSMRAIRPRIDSMTGRIGLSAYRRLRRGLRRLVMRTPMLWKRAPHSLAICPGLERFGQAVMLGTGTRAKVFDFENGLVYHVPVTSSALAFFEQELDARIRSTPYVPGPRLIDHDSGEIPYLKEELISGSPWTGDATSSGSHLEILSGLANMYRAVGPTSMPAAEYVSELTRRFGLLSDQCGRDTPEATRLANSLNHDLEEMGIENNPVTIVMAHGDFTAKNLLVDRSSGRTILLDWEYAGRATLLHDAIHFATVPMLESGDSSALSDFIYGDGSGPGSRMIAAVGTEDAGFDTPDGRRVMVALYFLEREARFLERLAAHGGADSNMALRFDRAIDTIELAIVASDDGRNPGRIGEKLVGSFFR